VTTELHHHGGDTPEPEVSSEAEHQSWRLRLEDFQQAADAQGLHGHERDATRLFFVEGVPEKTIARKLCLKVKRVKELLDRGEAKLDAWMPPCGMGGTGDVIRAMKGPRRHDPEAPLSAFNKYTGVPEEVVIRSPYPQASDVRGTDETTDEQGREAKLARGQKTGHMGGQLWEERVKG
jgi:hypothetical protein